MNIIFCNIAWMKYYEGFTEEDKPKHGGSFVNENEYGYVCENFLDYNEKCYGFVMLGGDIALESHFKETTIETPNIKDVLVVWVATNDDNEERIVGWYENAIVHREEQYLESYTNSDFALSYRIEAISEDCYLIPEEERDFQIQRVTQSGEETVIDSSNVWYADSSFVETGLISKVTEYIDNYNGNIINLKYTKEILNELVEDSSKEDFKELFDEGTKLYENDNYIESLRYLNRARSIKETTQVVWCIAECLFALNQYNKAIPLFNKVTQLEGTKIETERMLVFCYDRTFDRQKTLESLDKLIDLLGNSEENIEEKADLCWIGFYICLDLRDEENAKIISDKMLSLPSDESKEFGKEMKNILKEEFVK